MKKCTKDNLQFPDDRRFCVKCGAILVEDFESATLMMPKMRIKPAEFIEMNDDRTFQLSIRNQTYKLSMEEIRVLAAEACAAVKAVERQLARAEN